MEVAYFYPFCVQNLEMAPRFLEHCGSLCQVRWLLTVSRPL